MFFQQISVGHMDNFSYLIGCPETKKCATIDPGWEPEKIFGIAEENGYTIEKIFLTHVHYDHSGAADALAEETGAEIWVHEKSLKKESKEGRGMWIIPKKNIHPITPPQHFQKKEGSLHIGNLTGNIYSAPGHQDDHLLIEFFPYLFTGDVLFIGRAGRTDLPDSDPSKVPGTMKMIRELSDDLMVCPGHDYGEVPMRSLGEEKEKNLILKK